MGRRAAAVRPRITVGGFFSAVLLAALALAVAPRGVEAQARPDTTAARDTTARADSAAAAARDTVPPPVLPEFPTGDSASFGAGIWVFDRDDLLRSAAVTLAELLERIPGVTPIQAGFYAQPSALAALGGAGGRVELYLDGYGIDPLSSAAVDLSRVELAELARVRVERRFDVLRIDLTSATPTDPRPYARIDAGVTDPRGNLFRGVFLAPHFLIGPFAGAVERLDTQGFSRDEGGNETGGWLKWGWIRPRFGVQAEFRTGTTERSENVPWVGDFHRTDWTLRARARPAPGLTAEAYYGGSSIEDPTLGLVVFDPTTGEPTPVPDTTVTDSTLELSGRQAGIRLGYERGPVWALGALRFRTDALMPGTEADLSAGVRLGGVAELDGGFGVAGWDGERVTSAHLRGRITPRRGVSLFAEYGGGERGTVFLRDSATGGTLFTDRKGVRGGLDLQFGRLAAGGAVLRVDVDSAAPFGLPFDRIDRLYAGATMTGFEGYARLRVWGPFSVEGSGNRWSEDVRPIYTPGINWRAGVVYEATPLPSGNLNIYARAEARSRGSMLVPAPTVEDLRALAVIPAVTGYDLFLSIRILDFRIFLRWEDLYHNRQVFDIPGRFIPGPRLFYGVKWQFFD